MAQEQDQHKWVFLGCYFWGDFTSKTRVLFSAILAAMESGSNLYKVAPDERLHWDNVYVATPNKDLSEKQP